MENKKKYILGLIITIIAIISLGTYAWLTYRTNSTAMVFTVGDIETLKITVETYQINENIAPVLAYTSGAEVNVDITNNGINTGAGRLYYQINKIDEPLRNSKFKWTIERSTDGGTNYEVYQQGNFSSATTTEELTILEDNVPANTSYKYKVYIWLDGSSSQNLTEGSVFNGELRAEILSHYLYDVLKKAAADGTYAREYTGLHQDSMDPSKSTQQIYYWYGTSASNGTTIQNMNNVIFGNHCWQMIRTTDTGGVRMIYNGEPENGQCLDTRGTHVGYGSRTGQNLASDYYYGTDYTYDATNNVFSIAGTTSSATWNATTGPTLVGKYTCKGTTANATCATIYLVESYYSASSGYVIPISKTSHYSQFGTLQFNANGNSPTYVGYMYNTVYPVTSKYNSYYISNSNKTINNSHYYADAIDYGNIASGKYTLTNPQLISSLANTSDLVGKYILNNGSSASDTTAQYIVGINGSTLYYHNLTGGDLSTSLMMGDSYTDNNNGTYTIQGATQVSYVDWYSSSSVTREGYKGKYVCDGNSATCSNLKHITADQTPNSGSYYYYSVQEHSYKYGEGVSYQNGTYTLNGDIKTIWDVPNSTELAKITSHRYSCFSSDTSCTAIKYINYYSNYIYYAELTGTSNIATALTDMLTASDVNTKNSTIKSGIDEWYKKFLYPNFDEYIDDTIYCNDRRIRSLGGWNPSSGLITGSSAYLQFQEYTSGNDLSCANVTDSFSVSNSSARLTYKVGLISNPEMYLLNQNNARKTGQYFWLGSPQFFFSNSASGRFVGSGGGVSNDGVGRAYGVRPAVSLTTGIEYSEGDGSMANPYIVSAGMGI